MMPDLLKHGAEVTYNVVAYINEIVHGAWIEGLIVALALHIYFCHSVWFGTTKAKNGTTKADSKTDRRSSKLFSSKIGWGSGTEAKQVQRFIANIIGKNGKCPSDILVQYENLIRTRRVDLRSEVRDDQNARSLYVALITSNLESGAGAWQWTLRLLQDMRGFRFPRSLEFYTTVMKLHVQAQLLKEVLSLHDEMMADGISPDQNVYIMLLNVSTSVGDSDRAVSVFECLSKLGPMSVRTYMTVLRVYSRNKDWRGAVQLLDRMESDGTAPDNLVLNNVLGMCVSLGQVEAVEGLLPRHKGVADVVSCNILLKGFTQQAELPRAETLLAKMMSEGPTPNTISFNTIMDCAVRALQVLSGDKLSATSANSRDGNSAKQFAALARRPWELLEKLDALGLEPDRYTCSTLVKGMHLAGCTMLEIDRAVALLQRVGPVALQGEKSATSTSVGSNARLVEVLFNTLLDACVTVRDLDRMSEIFEMMQQFKVGVSAVTFGTLIKAFGQAGKLTRCHEVWEDMQNSGIKPTIVTFGCYIDACMRNEDLTEAYELFNGMMKQGVRPNAVVYTSLIRGFAHAKQPGKALDLYRRMRCEGIEATCVTFNSILDVVARQLSEPSALQEVVDDMREANIEPDVVTYSILLKASCSTGNLRNALSLFRQIRSHGLVFDQVAFNTLLQACSKADQVTEAEEVFEEMCRVGILPSHVTTSILVKMYGKAHMLEKAIALSGRMEKEYGRKPNLFVYTCLIQACVQNKHVRRSWEIFNSMLRAGVEPDAITYGTVIHGCVYLNRFEHAMTLVRHAYGLPAKPSTDSEVPFAVDAMPLKHIVPLQPEVLQTLLTALRRKEQSTLAAELQDVLNTHLNDHPFITKDASAARRRNGFRARRPAGNEAVDT